MGFKRRSEEGVKKGIRKVISQPVTREGWAKEHESKGAKGIDSINNSL